MRRAGLLFCYVFLAFTFATASVPVVAADLGGRPEAYPDEGAYSGNRGLTEREMAELCYGQGHICRKVCDLRSNFDDRFDGCSQNCESRAIRCMSTGCYRWSEAEYLIAENFGGYRCPSRSSLGLAQRVLK